MTKIIKIKMFICLLLLYPNFCFAQEASNFFDVKVLKVIDSDK